MHSVCNSDQAAVCVCVCVWYVWGREEVWDNLKERDHLQELAII